MAEDHNDRRRSGDFPGPLGPGASLERQAGSGAPLAGESFTLDSYGAVGPYGSVEFSLSGDPAAWYGPPDQYGTVGPHGWEPSEAGGWHDPESDERGPREPDGRRRPEPDEPDGRRRPDGAGRRRIGAARRVTAGVTRLPRPIAKQHTRDLISRVRAPVIGGHHRVVVMSLKGGVGKTTAAVGLGSTLASLRGDRVIAVDANPDRGTLSDKVTLETAATVRDLLTARDQIHGHADMRSYTSLSSSGLEILASEQDPAVSVAFGADDYAAVCQILENYYTICLTDCGTGLLHSAMAEVLRLADQIVLASTPAVDSARSASATLDWLAAHGYGDLADNAVLVLSALRPRSRSTVSLDLLEEHFSARCRAVSRIPYDVRLDEGAEVELDQLSGKTSAAFLELAALVADGFAAPRRVRDS